MHDAVHIGHSTGGGEVVRYPARHGESRAAESRSHQRVPTGPKEDNPGGVSAEVFGEHRKLVAPGHHGCCQGASRRDRRVLADRFRKDLKEITMLVP